MQIVIDIPEDVYKTIIADKYAIYDKMYYSIKNGTPLTKGHGRLIDADSIYQIVRPIEQSDAEWEMTAETAIRLMHEVINRAPTIIEADTESEG